VKNALKELGARVKEPWTAAGVSRETWRRWNLPPGAKNAQAPRPASEAGLLAALRRLRLSNSHEAKVRATTGISIRATDRYEGVERTLGRSTFNWSQGEVNRFANDMMNAYLVTGIASAVDVWLAAAPKDAGWAQEWAHPDSHGSRQSMDIAAIDMTSDPAHAGRSGRARRR
jgi:hypothetical protein